MFDLRPGGLAPSVPGPIDFLGIKIHPISIEVLFAYMKQIIQSGQKSIIANVNVNAINLSFQLPWFRYFLKNANVVFCDGWGVILGARLFGFCIPQRITYADWIWDAGRFLEKNGFTLFLLGAHQKIVDIAATKLKQRFPRLQIAGVHHGYFNKTKGSEENNAVITMINKTGPNVLLLGFGMPLQERWLLENWKDLRVNIALTGGAVFDYTAGVLRRAPKFLREKGFEWLGRLLIEPRRLWKRYVFGNTVYCWRVLKERLK